MSDKNNWILFVASIVLFSLMFEIVLRQFFSQPTIPEFIPTGDRETFGMYDELLGWRMRPFAEGNFFSYDFSTQIKINSKGFRDREYQLNKNNSKIRIAVVGDSYAWGFGVQYYESFPKVLEKMISDKMNAEVLNFGVSGYGTDQFYILINNTVLDYDPDIVIITFHPNDLENAGESEQYSYPKPLFIIINESLKLTNVPVPKKEKWDNRVFKVWQRINFFLSKKLHSYVFLKARLKDILQHYFFKDVLPTSDSFDIYRKTYLGKYEEYEKIHFALYGEINKIVKNKNSRLILLIIPDKYSIDERAFNNSIEKIFLNHSNYQIDKPIKLIKEMSEKNNIESIDLFPYFKNKPNYYFKKDSHLTAEGHAVVAQIIKNYLIKES